MMKLPFPLQGRVQDWISENDVENDALRGRFQYRVDSSAR